MDPVQDQFGGVAPDFIEVAGLRSMIITRTSLKMDHPSRLSYYRGIVKSGSQLDRLDGCRATILKLKKEDAEKLCTILNEVDHPCLMRALGLGSGTGDDSKYSYVALESFEGTFAPYTRKQGPSVDQNGRLTEEFITLFSNVVIGMEELHNMGYYCRLLRPDSIAVLRKAGSVSAKIWEFERCDAGMEEEQKDCDWVRLGTMIFEVAWTYETLNLVNKIKGGQLKGQSILKHCALLTVRKKFQNVLALNFYISVYCPEDKNQGNNALDISGLSAANLKSDLDKKLVWHMPGWIMTSVATQTLRGFIKELRNIFEHEAKFIPSEMTMEDILKLKKAKDLDHQLQASCGEIMVALQKLVDELKLDH